MEVRLTQGDFFDYGIKHIAEFTYESPEEIAKEMIAFANSHGGAILFGVEDKTGELLGLSYEQIQQISRELANAAQEQVRPIIYIETEVVRIDDKHFLVCSVLEGKNKPYKNLQGEIWVKQGADKRRITENVEILYYTFLQFWKFLLYFVLFLFHYLQTLYLLILYFY